MADQIFIQRRYTMQVDGYQHPYCDAIVLPREQYDLLTEKEINNIKLQRKVDIEYNLAHPTIPEDIPADIQLIEVVKQIDELTAKKIELEAIIAIKEPIKELVF